MNPYLLTLIISLLIQLCFFILAFTFQTDKFTDLTYGLTFILVVLFLSLTYSPLTFPQILISILITIWATRLAGYLSLRILKIKKDKRFDQVRNSFLKFAQFWLLQGASVWIIILPATYLLTLSSPQPHPLTLIGALFFLLGLVIESLADFQKFIFKNEHPNTFITSSVWKYSRHPNYFGEIIIWLGIFIITLPYQQSLSWLTVSSPLFITTLLLFISGIPPLEERHQQKYGSQKKYQQYKKSTSLLIPLPPKK